MIRVFSQCNRMAASDAAALISAGGMGFVGDVWFATLLSWIAAEWNLAFARLTASEPAANVAAGKA